MVGEQNQERGREGVRKAKQWLEGTTRAETLWTCYEAGHAPKLEVPFENAENRSFDMSGLLKGDDLNNQQFFAEVKNYEKATTGSLGTDFASFLQLCYRAMEVDPAKYDRFMWITWTPFNLTHWHRLTSHEFIKQAVERVGTPSGGDADSALCRTLAQRLWLILLTPGVEALAATEESLKALRVAGVGRGGGRT